MGQRCKHLVIGLSRNDTSVPMPWSWCSGSHSFIAWHFNLLQYHLNTSAQDLGVRRHDGAYIVG